MAHKSEVEGFLIEHGFRYQRQTKTGELWSDGISSVLVGAQVLRGGRNLRNFEAEVRRAVRKRPGWVLDVHPGALSPRQRRATYVPPGEPLSVKLGDVAPRIAQDKPKPPSAHLPPNPEPAAPRTPVPAPATPIPQKEETPMSQTQSTPQDDARAILAKRRTQRRFDVMSRFEITERIKNLAQTGMTHPRIVLQLRKEGFKMSNGDLLDPRWVLATMNRMEREGMLKKLINPVVIKETPVEAKAPEPTPPAPPASPEPQKLAPAPAPARRRLLPEAAIAILTDPDLTNDDKITMLMTFVNLKGG
jgi:hypothetical protein